MKGALAFSANSPALIELPSGFVLSQNSSCSSSWETRLAHFLPNCFAVLLDVVSLEATDSLVGDVILVCAFMSLDLCTVLCVPAGWKRLSVWGNYF